MKVKYLTKMGLQKFTNGRPTQNVVMKCDKMPYVDIKSVSDIPFKGNDNKFILFLD
jgi:tRNA G18 (ribose-2'-O)-methylase SpoU